MKRLFASWAIVCLAASPAAAETIDYSLDKANSQVAYEVSFDKDTITGSIPIESADIRLDFGGGASRAKVVLVAAEATSSFPFAEQALKGPKVLDTAEFPRMTFESPGFRFGTTEASIPGEVTIRGVTRPVTLHAQVYRQQGTEPGDLSKVSVHLTGTVSRAAFGASGWKDMVGDEVTIKIIARLDQAG